MLQSFSSIFQPWLSFLAEDPLLRMVQFGILLLSAVVVFLVFFTTRDILLRTQSFPSMFGSILLVALLPVAGFFLYLLIRPSRTLRERELETMIRDLWEDRRRRSGGKGGSEKRPERSPPTPHAL